VLDSPRAEPNSGGRNLIICCDGTHNEFGSNNTNVVRLIQVLNRNPNKQRLFYDPGVGTLPEPVSWGRIKKVWFDLCDLAFAKGLPDRVQNAYGYLMDVWQPGDRVFLFGFSRGAYTVRVLAGLLHGLGLLPRGGTNLVPYAYRLFKAVRKESKSKKNSYWDICDKFRWTFARPVAGDEENRRFPIHFLGVWDTVSSVGWVWNPTKFPYTATNPGIKIVRHAVSVDERRSFFRSNLVKTAPNQDVVEGWFPGVHCDIGGGYADSEIWRVAFEWMLKEAEKAGLGIDPNRLATVLGTVPQQPWRDKIHESLTLAWQCVEWIPKFPYSAKTNSHHIYFNFGKPRPISPGALMHRTVLERIADPELRYAPPNIPVPFRTRPLDSASEFISL
jgi:uncharacterized protein (DUF2235 family)